ncbi:MAG: iron-containing alcohol dehydrogenase, partial [Bacilli bacterium]|nr:iron-containing alcohol dehydrogenase [Bacilli bacterium]
QEIAQLLGLKASTPEEGVESLAKAIIGLIREIGLEPNLEAYGIEEKDWESRLQSIAELAYEDQCSPANPRLPMVDDMVVILRKAFRGN